MNTSDPVQLLLSKLDGVKPSGTGKWIARCPAHADVQQSLGIKFPGDNGAVILTCYAGCDTKQIVAALGMGMSDLWSPKEKPARAARPQIVATYDYVEENGTLLYQAVRYRPKGFKQRRPDGRGWSWNLGDAPRVPYHLPELIAAVQAGKVVFICEGEKDVDALRAIGLTATTNAAGAEKWRPEYVPFFQGAHVVILPDNDEPGRKHARTVARALHPVAASLRVVQLPDLPVKGDVSDWLKAGGSASDLRQIAKAAPLWEPTEEDTDADQADDSALTEGLPAIETNHRRLREQSADALSAILSSNDPPTVFVRAGRLARVESDEDDRAGIAEFDEAMLRGHMDRCANWISTSDRRGAIPIHPPAAVVKDLLSLPQWPGVPALSGIVTAPLVAPDGTLRTEPGYLPDARVYYHAPGTLALPDNTPTPENISAAKTLLLDTLMRDFPFVDQSSRAHALALLLLPFVRLLIPGPTPFHLIDAPTAGTGKSLLAELVSIPFVPGAAIPTTAAEDEDEWRKKITSSLLRGPSHFWVDNIQRRLVSGQLAAAITAVEWSDRRLGQSEDVTLPVRCVWVGTGNNATLSDEITRRTLWIRLDARVERPWLREGFHIGDIKAWARQERPKLIAAALTLVRAWLEAGRPKYSGKPLGSFERWSEIIGGILETIEVPGFLANASELYDRLDPEREAWGAFLTKWHKEYGDNPKGVSEIFPLATEDGLLLEALGPGSEQSQKIALGRLLRNKRDRIYGEYRLCGAKGKARAAQYVVSIVSVMSSLDPNAETYTENVQADTLIESGGIDSKDSLYSHAPVDYEPVDTEGISDPFSDDDFDPFGDEDQKAED